MERLNITLPEELTRDLENIPNKSRFIAVALKEKLERERKKGWTNCLWRDIKQQKWRIESSIKSGRKLP